MIGRNTEIDEFQALVCAINEKLGPSSGIDSADVDKNELQELMQAYTSNESEWKKYFFASDKIPYTRNVVDKGNGKSNLLVLVWGPGKKSPIHDTHRLFLDLPEDPEDPERTIVVHGLSLLHDEATVFADLLIVASVQKTCRHANAHCIMKVLKGRLTETRFATPTEFDIQNQRPMTKIRETTYSENEVTYMADSLGVHRISNPDSTDYAVSLHLYTPPNAATYGCNVFNEENSGLIHIKQCHFYSEYGIKIERD